MLELLSLFCCGNFVGPTDFGSPTVKTVGLFRTVVETFDFFVGATFLTFVGPTVLGPYYCWEDFSPFFGPKIFGSQDCWSYFPVFCCRSNKRCESGSNKWLKSQANTNSFQLLGVQNCCITTLFPNKREKGLLVFTQSSKFFLLVWWPVSVGGLDFDIK